MDVRESPFGQAVRWATNNKYFKYDEELEGFQIPWTTTQPADEKPGDGQTSPHDASSQHSTVASRSREALQRINTARDEEMDPAVRLASIRSRESTRPWSRERAEVERDLAVDREKSNVIVPQTTADGVILVDWYTTDDKANPQNWSSWKKVYAVMIVFFYTLVVYSTSSISVLGQEMIMEEFNLSFAEGSSILSLYVIGYGLGPLLFSPLSEVPAFGRNIPYIISFGLFVILSIPTALVKNYPGLLVLRFLVAFMGSPCLATGGASIQDLYALPKLPYGFTAWVAAAFCGPALGPLLSGFAIPVLGWRWAFWEVVIMSAPLWVLWFLTMPETSADNILLRRAQRLRKLTGNDNFKAASEIKQANKKFSEVVYEALLVPFLITIKDPAVLYINVFSSLIYSTYYSFFEAFPITYVGVYGFNLGQLGVVFTGTIIPGGLVGMTIYVVYQWFYMEPDVRKRGLRPEFEHRLIPGAIAVWFLPISLFWYAYTGRADIHWAASVVGLVMFAAAAFVLFQSLFIYLPLSYPKYAASLFAMNDAFRSALASGGIIYAHPLYENLGVAHGVTILASLMIVGCFGIVGLYFFGAKLRARSKFTG